GSLLLLLTALIWGCAFVSQRIGMSYVEPFTFNSIRTFIGGLFLIPFIPLFCRNKPMLPPKGQDRSMLLTGGLVCGLLLCLATNLQQVGIQYTSAGKAGFITSLYIVLVPCLGLFIGQRIGKLLWAAVLLAVVGLYLLCMSGKLVLERGDLYILLCALTFAFHILAVGYFATRTDGIKLSCLQFLISGAVGMLLMFMFETTHIKDILACTLPILYAGIFSCGLAYTFQIIGQKHVDPTVASLLMSFESVFAALSGWAILGEQFSVKELSGCILMFCAVILAQLPEKKK
ncbi:MAG: DMT family transporter, partial [Spirochaetia bacterium]|nr:DMT family transporter [Spirochaetia bacterium]